MDLQTVLEREIDKTSVEQVLEAIAQVCYAKAEHIASNWQDEPLAREWQRKGAQIEALPLVIDALIELVKRCDGSEGVRADGSNIDTLAAHMALAKAKGEDFND